MGTQIARRAHKQVEYDGVAKGNGHDLAMSDTTITMGPPNGDAAVSKAGDRCGLRMDPHPLEDLIPPCLSNEERVAMTTRCRDAVSIPKVPGAGSVQLEPDGTRVQIMHNGIKVLADGYYGDWTTRLITLCQGHHEPQEERVFHEVVSRLP